jgi:hypothetical protein
VLIKLWRRAGELYLWSVGLTLVFTTWIVLAGRPAGAKAGVPEIIHLPQLLWRTITLQYVYGWADFLSHYAIFMLIAPLALYLLHKRQAWLVVVLSAVAWLWRGQQFEMAWQLLFFGGLLAGYYLADLESWVGDWRPRQRTTAYWGIVSAAVMSVVASVWMTYVQPLTIPGRYYFVLDKYSMGPGRLLAVALWFTALYLVFTRYQVTIRRHLGWLLLPLGRNSLFVYISHAFIILGINLLLPASLSAVQNIAINLAVLALIWALAVIKAQTAPQANNAWERFVPAALTISLFTVLIGLHG